MQNLGKVFQAMADGTRRKILELLRETERSAGDIADHFKMTKPAISHHLSVLKEAGLATERRDGQHIIYSLREDSIVEAMNGFLSNLCTAKKVRNTRRKTTTKTKK
jgi:DNA-binding transcriptional ArsR family regulator